MKMHKTVATRAAPFGSDIHHNVWEMGKGGGKERGIVGELVCRRVVHKPHELLIIQLYTA